MSSPCFPRNPDMLGYWLNWRREATLSLQMETEIERMLNEEKLNNVTEAGTVYDFIVLMITHYIELYIQLDQNIR